MKYKFTGWVEKIGELGKYDREIIIREKEERNADYQNYITFTVKAKMDDKVEGLAPNTKVEIEFFLNGIMGVSKTTNKPYNINRLTLAGITVLDASCAEPVASAEPSNEPSADPETLPF